MLGQVEEKTSDLLLGLLIAETEPRVTKKDTVGQLWHMDVGHTGPPDSVSLSPTPTCSGLWVVLVLSGPASRWRVGSWLTDHPPHNPSEERPQGCQQRPGPDGSPRPSLHPPRPRPVLCPPGFHSLTPTLPLLSPPLLSLGSSPGYLCPHSPPGWPHPVSRVWALPLW